MRFPVTTLVYIMFMVLEVRLLCLSGNLKGFSLSEDISFNKWRRSNSNGGINKNFSNRRISSHGFRLHTNHVPEEQKRITPNGANPLHNWWDGGTSKHIFDCMHAGSKCSCQALLSCLNLSSSRNATMASIVKRLLWLQQQIPMDGQLSSTLCVVKSLLFTSVIFFSDES